MQHHQNSQPISVYVDRKGSSAVENYQGDIETMVGRHCRDSFKLLSERGQ